MTARPRRALAVVVGLVLATTGACATAGPGPVTHERASRPGPRASTTASPTALPTGSPTSTPSPSPPPPRPPITKVLTVVVENHSLPEMKAEMPYVYGLATRYAYADHYSAITHPSLPNYLAMASGSTQGVVDDEPPAAHLLHGQTVFDQALALGRTATVYADSMTRNCQLVNVGSYAVRHNPWTYFVDGRAACLEHDVPATQLAADSRAGTLPDVGMLIPNVLHDAHDASLASADAWIRTQLRAVRSGPDWKSGRLAIVVTADEDDHSGPNRVLTVVASRYQRHLVVHAPLSHYSLTGLYDAVLGAPPLGTAAQARSLARAFRMSLAATG